MFFSINTQNNDSRFPINHAHSGFYIGLDAGWNRKFVQNTLIFYKGYCDIENLENILEHFLVDPTPKYTGNFGVIIVGADNVILTHDINRPFPVYIDNQNFVTNLTSSDCIETVWSDCYLTISHNKINRIKYNNYANLLLDFSNKLSVQECATQIKAIIDSKLKFVADTELPVNMFLSGGLDTTLLYAVAKQNFGNCKILNYEHIEYDSFLLQHYNSLRKEFVVYNQLHYWKNSTLTFSGAPGDEYFMRGPYVAGLWAAWHNIDLLAVLDQTPRAYHRYHFLKNKKTIEHFYNIQSELQKTYPTEDTLMMQILNVCANDHQMWHLGNTLTWTPFKDLRILGLTLRLSPEDMLLQILNGDLSRAVIALYDPKCLNIVSNQKNLNGFENLLKDPDLSKLFS